MSAGKADVRSEIRQKVLDNAIHNCDQVMKRWEQRFRLSCPDFANRFQSGLQNVIVHLRSSPDPKEIHVVEYIKEASPGSLLARPVAHHMSSNIQNQPVLTNVVELVQETKSFVTASVRLYAFDEFYSIRMNQMFYSLQSGFGTGSAIREREVDSSEDTLRRTRSVCHDKLISEVVKGSDQVTDDVSSRAQCIEGDMKYMDKARLMLEGLDLTLSARSITVKLIERRFHVSQILFGPLDLGVDQT